jgi:hypothetical protein
MLKADFLARREHETIDFRLSAHSARGDAFGALRPVRKGLRLLIDERIERKRGLARVPAAAAAAVVVVPAAPDADDEDEETAVVPDADSLLSEGVFDGHGDASDEDGPGALIIDRSLRVPAHLQPKYLRATTWTRAERREGLHAHRGVPMAGVGEEAFVGHGGARARDLWLVRCERVARDLEEERSKLAAVGREERRCCCAGRSKTEHSAPPRAMLSMYQTFVSVARRIRASNKGLHDRSARYNARTTNRLNILRTLALLVWILNSLLPAITLAMAMSQVGTVWDMACASHAFAFLQESAGYYPPATLPQMFNDDDAVPAGGRRRMAQGVASLQEQIEVFAHAMRSAQHQGRQLQPGFPNNTLWFLLMDGISACGLEVSAVNETIHSPLLAYDPMGSFRQLALWAGITTTAAFIATMVHCLDVTPKARDPTYVIRTRFPWCVGIGTVVRGNMCVAWGGFRKERQHGLMDIAFFASAISMLVAWIVTLCLVYPDDSGSGITGTVLLITGVSCIFGGYLVSRMASPGWRRSSAGFCNHIPGMYLLGHPNDAPWVVPLRRGLTTHFYFGMFVCMSVAVNQLTFWGCSWMGLQPAPPGEAPFRLREQGYPISLVFVPAVAVFLFIEIILWFLTYRVIRAGCHNAHWLRTVLAVCGIVFFHAMFSPLLTTPVMLQLRQNEGKTSISDDSGFLVSLLLAFAYVVCYNSIRYSCNHAFVLLRHRPEMASITVPAPIRPPKHPSRPFRGMLTPATAAIAYLGLSLQVRRARRQRLEIVQRRKEASRTAQICVSTVAEEASRIESLSSGGYQAI